MSSYFVVRDRRSFAGWAKGWKRVALYDTREIASTVVPTDILEHYLANRRPPLGQATLDGLTELQLRTLTRLIKGRKVRAIENRWGDIAAYQLEREVEKERRGGLPPLFGAPWERSE